MRRSRTVARQARSAATATIAPSHHGRHSSARRVLHTEISSEEETKRWQAATRANERERETNVAVVLAHVERWLEHQSANLARSRTTPVLNHPPRAATVASWIACGLSSGSIVPCPLRVEEGSTVVLLLAPRRAALTGSDRPDGQTSLRLANTECQIGRASEPANERTQIHFVQAARAYGATSQRCRPSSLARSEGRLASGDVAGWRQLLKSSQFGLAAGRSCESGDAAF